MRKDPSIFILQILRQTIDTDDFISVESVMLSTSRLLSWILMHWWPLRNWNCPHDTTIVLYLAFTAICKMVRGYLERFRFFCVLIYYKYTLFRKFRSWGRSHKYFIYLKRIFFGHWAPSVRDSESRRPSKVWNTWPRLSSRASYL